MIHSTSKRNLFGVPLTELFNNEPHHAEFEIPMFLATIILFIDSHGRIPGIFKTKVDNSEVEGLLRGFEEGGEVELLNPHAVAGLLLLFLVLLPDPVLCNNYSQYIDAARDEDVMTLQQLVSHLPPCNYLLLRAILLLLHNMSIDVRLNDVGTSDLAQILTPLLLMGPVSSMERDMEEIITLGQLFIEEYDIILAPFEEYATMIDNEPQVTTNLEESDQPSPQPPTSTHSSPPPTSSHPHPSTSTQSQIAPFQRSKYSVNYEVKPLSSSQSPPSLFPSHSPLPAQRPIPSSSLYSAPSHISAPSLQPSLPPSLQQSASPTRSPSLSSTASLKSPPHSLTSTSTTTSQQPTHPHPTTHTPSSPIPSHPITHDQSSPTPSQPVTRVHSTMVGIYGSDPGLKYTQSNEQLRQLDTRFEEMVEDMQEKRVLFLNQIDNIRRRMVFATPGLYTPPRLAPALSRSSSVPTYSPSPPHTSTPSRTATSSLVSSSPHTSTRASTPPRSLTPTSVPPPRSPISNSLPPRSPTPNSPLSSRSTPSTQPRNASPALRMGAQSPVSQPFEPLRVSSSTLLKTSSSPLFRSLSGDEEEIGDIEQLLQETRIVTAEERDIESLHHYYYDKMKALYTEIQSLKSTVRSLQKDVSTTRMERQETQDLTQQKDEKIRLLELEIERLKNPEEANKTPLYRPPLPPERKAPSPPPPKASQLILCFESASLPQ